LRAFQGGNYDLARRQFDAFQRLYPKSELADQAQYYLADSYHHQHDLRQAIAGYDKLLRDFPASDIAPRAQLRKAEALVQSGERVAGGRELRSLIARYPNSEEARQVQQRLQRFEQADSTLGLQVRELNPQMARRLGLSSTEGGLLVRQVEPGSFAQKLGLRRGDIITAVNGRSVRSQRALMEMQRSLTPGREVVVRVKRRQRGRGTRELTLRGTP
jgi:tol-pal system protein YbgF